MRLTVRNILEFSRLAVSSAGTAAIFLTGCSLAATILISQDPTPRAAAIAAAAAGNGLLLLLAFVLWFVPFLTTFRFTAASRRVGRSHRINGAVLGCEVAVACYFVGLDLTRGDWISRQGFAPFVAPAAATVGALVFFAVGNALSRALQHLRSGGGVSFFFAAATAVLSVLCIVADRLIFPKQYPSFHYLLHGTAVLFSSIPAVFLFMHFSRNLSPRRRTVLFGFALIAFAAPLVVFPTVDAKRRKVPADFAPLSATVLRCLLPAGPPIVLSQVLKEIEMAPPSVAPRPGGHIRIPKDWNIILIVVDTLRADALPPNRKAMQKFARENDTPFLNQRLKDTFRFTRNYAPGSATVASLPSIFQSSEGDRKMESGVWLQDRMKALGYKPIAVIYDFFTAKIGAGLNRLFHNYDITDTYDRRGMDMETDKMLAAIDRAKQTPFFAWFHFYSMHSPAYAGKASASEAKNGYTAEYRKGLRWLDREIKKLFAGIEKRGLLEKSVIVLTADHGESLYDHGYRTHGNSIYDEEVRVPLAFRIPGRKGGRIDALTGSIDLMPTLLDLIGEPADPRLHGTSLVPLMVNPRTPHTNRYYLRNKKGDLTGMVQGTDKIAYSKTDRIFFRHDLRTDPKEKADLFDPDNPLDNALAAAFALKNPAVYKEQLDDRGAQILLRRKLSAVHDRTPKDTAAFLLQLAAMDGSPEIRKILEALSANCDNQWLKAQIQTVGRAIDKAVH